MKTTADIAAETLGQLAAGLRGELILPGDPDYDASRAVYNGMIDKHPAAIARCRDVADVITCVRFGRDHGLELAVRGGGHNAAGLGVADDALVIDLSLLRSTTVDPENHTVRADAGCTWGDVDHATVAFGMATPSGFLASTGVAGLTLGGGIGYLSRRFGLTVDNLLAADVVLADGTLVTASASSHSDLFWALRGGGGNFGIVTSFTFRCHDIGEGGTIIGGPVFYDLADVGEVMRWYRELIPSLPEELSGWIALLTVPPVPPFPEALWGRKVCGIVWCYTGRARPGRGDARAGQDVRLTADGGPAADAVQRAAEHVRSASTRPGCSGTGGRTSSTRSPTRRSRCTASTASCCRPAIPPCTCTPSTARPAGWPADATAFAYRDGGWAGVIVGVDPDPANADCISQWAKDYWQELHPTSAGGGYVNFLMDEGQDRVKAAYRGNYDRLAQIKERYDPDNIFHVNQNIQPASHHGPVSGCHILSCSSIDDDPGVVRALRGRSRPAVRRGLPRHR